jgi:hypothetical protein
MVRLWSHIKFQTENMKGGHWILEMCDVEGLRKFAVFRLWSKGGYVQSSVLVIGSTASYYRIITVDKYYTCETSFCPVGGTYIGFNLPVNKIIGRNYIKDKVNGKCVVLPWGNSDKSSADYGQRRNRRFSLPIYCLIISPSLRMTVWWRNSPRMERCHLSCKGIKTGVFY